MNLSVYARHWARLPLEGLFIPTTSNMNRITTSIFKQRKLQSKSEVFVQDQCQKWGLELGVVHLGLAVQAFVIPVTQECEAEGFQILDVPWVKHKFKSSSNSLARSCFKTKYIPWVGDRSWQNTLPASMRLSSNPLQSSAGWETLPRSTNQWVDELCQITFWILNQRFC